MLLSLFRPKVPQPKAPLPDDAKRLQSVVSVPDGADWSRMHNVGAVFDWCRLTAAGPHWWKYPGNAAADFAYQNEMTIHILRWMVQVFHTTLFSYLLVGVLFCCVRYCDPFYHINLFWGLFSWWFWSIREPVWYRVPNDKSPLFVNASI